MKLVVVDGYTFARDGLASLLTQLRPQTVVLQAADLADALRLASEHNDLSAVILAVGTPSRNELEALDAFATARADLPVVIVSASEADPDAREALVRGAFGYVPKSAGPRTLLSAIRLVLDGERYVPPLILQESPGRPALTNRQIEVLRG